MDDKQVRSDEARRNLRDLLDEVEHHDVHVTILRYDKPAGVIVSVDWHEQAKALIAASEQQQRAETHYEDSAGWHRKHDVYGGPHDEPPVETPGDPR